jgi:hypothetical protein
MKNQVEVYVLSTGQTVLLSMEDLRMSLALARLHTHRVSPPTPDEVVVLDRVEGILRELEKE